MNLLLAIAILGNLGSTDLQVEPNATIIDYTQSPTSLTIEGTDLIGGTLGGYFTSPKNWQYVENLGIFSSLLGENGNSLFQIEVYSGDSLDLVALYEGSTESLNPLSKTGIIPLQKVFEGVGNANDIRGIQFTWLGTGNPVLLTMTSFVNLSPPNPKITSYALIDSKFQLTWTGTGPVPVNIQRTTDLKTGPWITIASNITIGTYTDPTTPLTRAFYRVVVP